MEVDEEDLDSSYNPENDDDSSESSMSESEEEEQQAGVENAQNINAQELMANYLNVSRTVDNSAF